MSITEIVLIRIVFLFKILRRITRRKEGFYARHEAAIF
jgi:hypothetical protein